MVPGKGIEPTLSCLNQILSLARLPVPPPRHINQGVQVYVKSVCCKTFIRRFIHVSDNIRSMKRSDFTYYLPDHLIAQYPAEQRDGSRLLRLERSTGVCADLQFDQLADLLLPGDLLVFNDSRVIPARMFGTKDSGGKVEILVERVADEHRLIAQIRASKSPKPGTAIILQGDDRLIVEGREDEFYVLSQSGQTPIMHLLERYGHMPLPPYIRREDTAFDRERYQTVYARHPGAVAAPTAGLHFSTRILEGLRQRQISTGFVTLHVGAGTFKPVRAERISDHRMHREWFSVDDVLCAEISRTRASGGRVIAVGTTVVRCLESAAASGELHPVRAETDIFIYPGYQFRVIDGLITNFHLPESTLLMLVCAFAGTANTLHAYEHAVAAEYRFFSYGDAMLIL
jgi:S-adenosylmethionine:tRNA ribosyltransferase-isomerase